MGERGVLDTSVFVAREGRGAAASDFPEAAAISVITIAELELGVAVARDACERARRADTLEFARRFEGLPVTDSVARVYATLVATCRAGGVRPGTRDALIASTAIDRGVPVYTQDGDFIRMANLDGRLQVELV